MTKLEHACPWCKGEGTSAPAPTPDDAQELRTISALSVAIDIGRRAAQQAALLQQPTPEMVRGPDSVTPDELLASVIDGLRRGILQEAMFSRLPDGQLVFEFEPTPEGRRKIEAHWIAEHFGAKP